MPCDLIVEGGTIVSSQGQFVADVGIRSGKIVVIGDLASIASRDRISARGLHILPGVIDTQVHFREPGLTHKEDIGTGTLAAVTGGVTTIFEMPNTNPATSSQEALESKLLSASKTAWCDHAFFIGATAGNVEIQSNLEILPGTPGIKIFVGSSTGDLLVDAEDVLRSCLKAGKHRVPLHCEDETRMRERKASIQPTDVRQHPEVRDAEAAVIATRRVLKISAETGRPVHILHVSTLDELPLIAEAKSKGLPVTCEVTPQHLTLAAPDCYERYGTLAQMNPPIRTIEHQAALWEAVSNGLFDVMGSDHAPHTLSEKQQAYPASPSGIPGVQTMLPIMLDWVNKGRLSLERLVKLLCEGPTQIYGISQKGFIREGYDADLTLVDLGERWEITNQWLRSKCGWSPFEGMSIQGKPVMTVLRGEVVVDHGELIGAPRGKPVTFDWK